MHNPSKQSSLFLLVFSINMTRQRGTERQRDRHRREEHGLRTRREEGGRLQRGKVNEDPSFIFLLFSNNMNTTAGGRDRATGTEERRMSQKTTVYLPVYFSINVCLSILRSIKQYLDLITPHISLYLSIYLSLNTIISITLYQVSKEDGG